MVDIKEKYTSLQNVGASMPTGAVDDWITKFAHELKSLCAANWLNSINDLPEGKTIENENWLLLWHVNDGFTEAFYSGLNTPHKRSTREASPKKNLFHS